MTSNINIFDRVLKVLARDYPESFLALAVPGVSVQLLGTLENVELALPEERVDFVHRLDDNGQEKLLHIEFQTEHKSNVPQRAFVYSALLTRQFQREVVTLIIYLAQRKSPLPTAYEVQVGEEVMTRFEYAVIRLWEYADEIWAGRWPALAPLLTMLVDSPDTTVLARERDLILQEPDRHKQADLLACAVTIGARFFDKEFLWRFFREEVEIMREATFIEEWLEEQLETGLQRGMQQGLQQGLQQGMQQGMQQGLQQGKQQTAQALLRHILGRRFGPVPLALDLQLQAMTATQLENLVDAALDAPDLGTFQKAMSQAVAN